MLKLYMMHNLDYFLGAPGTRYQLNSIEVTMKTALYVLLVSRAA